MPYFWKLSIIAPNCLFYCTIWFKFTNHIRLETEISLKFLTTRNDILLSKLFWFTVRRNCSSDWEKNLKFEAEGREFAKLLRSLKQFYQTVKGHKFFWFLLFQSQLNVQHYTQASQLIIFPSLTPFPPHSLSRFL